MEGCHLIQLRINYKYDPRRALKLDPKGESISVEIDAHPHKMMEKLNGYLEFEGVSKHKVTVEMNLKTLDEKDVQGISLDESQDFFVCWGMKEAYFYNFKP